MKETDCDHYFARKSDGTLSPCEFCGCEKIDLKTITITGEITPLNCLHFFDQQDQEWCKCTVCGMIIPVRPEFKP